MTGKSVDHRVVRTGRRGLGEIRELVSRSTGTAAERVDTRLPTRTGIVYRGKTAVGVVGLHRDPGQLVIRAFHFLPEARGDLAIGFRESLRIGASEESRKVEVSLANPDPWAEDFLAPLVPPKPEDPKEEEAPGTERSETDADRPVERSYFPATSRIQGIALLAGLVAALGAWLLPVPFEGGFRWTSPFWFGWGVFVTLASLPALVAALLDPFRARWLGTRVLPLPRKQIFRGLSGIGGALLVVTGWFIVPVLLRLPESIRGGWLGVVLLAVLYGVLQHRLRRPGAREGGLSLPGPAVAVPWDEIGSWRRKGDRFRIWLTRWHPGLERREVSLDLHRGTADALAEILRREAPRAEET